MSVLIKGMDMPKRCWNCPLKKIDGMDIVCDVLRERVAIADDKILMGRLDRCPLVEIPPHGRLIDAEEFEKSLSTLLQFPSNLVNGQWIVNTIREQPTIIDAEE